MSLDNIQLPAFIIQRLFKNSLVDLKSTQSSPDSADTASFGFLGKNRQKTAILTRNPGALYLPEAELDFLMGILAACKLTMEDVALVNLHHHPSLDYGTLTAETGAQKILLLGTDPASIGLPIAFPQYQVQRFNNQVYLSAPALPLLQQDRMEKSKLWICLKQIFSL